MSELEQRRQEKHRSNAHKRACWTLNSPYYIIKSASFEPDVILSFIIKYILQLERCLSRAKNKAKKLPEAFFLK